VSRFLRLVSILAALAGAARLPAHDPGLSSLHLVGRGDSVDLVLQFAPVDAAYLAPLDRDGDGRVTRGEFEAARPALADFASRWMQVRDPAGPQLLTGLTASLQEQDNNVVIRAVVPVAPHGSWTLLFPRLLGLPPGHRHHVTVQVAGGGLVTEKLIDASEPWLAVAWDAGPAASPPGAALTAAPTGPMPSSPALFPAFLKLGVEHILIGYDHLLFLAGLLVACRRFGSMVAIITSFTVAHSLTLAAATFDLVSFPGRIVEPLIAASILYVGVENFVRRDPDRTRWPLTFLFGLVHGFGFAGVLRELGIGGAGLGAAWPLLGFNLGVELGQVAVAAVVLPALLYARRFPRFEKTGLPLISALVAAAGFFWTVERIRALF